MTPATDDDADDRTVIRPPSSPTTAPRPAADSGIDTASAFGHMLPEGTRIGGFEITGLIGEGGFGIVYLAYDPNLERHVALKEYMPSSLAARASGGVTVSVKSPRHAETFSAGLKSFVNEARLLARFDHPSLVKVYRFWEANGTAYMAMPYYEGPTLKQALAELGHRPDEALLRAWLTPLLDAMAVMHAAQCYHRDIAPDNILLTQGGPLLLDFGAARRVIGDMTQALTVVLKPGYAPIEQYGDVPTMTQGPWTDLYALASVVYYAITGKAPMSSVERLIDDRLQPLVETAAGQYGDAFLEAVDRALSVRPKDRPQDVAEFRALLGIEARDSAWGTTGSMPLSTPMADGPRTGPRTGHPRTGPRTGEAAAPAMHPVTHPVTRPVTQPPARAGTVTAPAPVTPPAPPAARTQAPPAVAAPVPEHPATARPSRTGLYIGAGVLAAAAAAVAGLLLGRAGEPVEPPATPASAPMTSSTPEPVAAPAPAPDTVVTPAPATPAAVPSPAPPAAPARAAAPEPAPRAPLVTAPTPPPAPTTAAPARAAPPPPAEPVAAEPVRTARPAPAAAPDTPPRANPARCSDILMKASLEPLNPAETAYLKEECK